MTLGKPYPRNIIALRFSDLIPILSCWEVDD
jgi:hypothetical protein